MKKRVLTLFLLLTLCLSACGTSAPSDGGSTESAEPQIPELHMEDIVWNVDSGIVDGQRRVMLDLTNHSPYPIVEMMLTFAEKPDVTDEQRESYYQDLRKALELDDEETNELRQMPIGMNAQLSRMLRPNEVDTRTPLCYYEGLYYVLSMDHCDMVQPDIATVRYIADGQLCTMYYDFVNQKADLDLTTEPAVYWPDGPLTQLLPKPESECIEDFLSGDDHLSVYVHGKTPADAEAYIAQCKEAGFTRDNGSYSDVCKLVNDDGYELTIDPNEDENKMEIDLRAPETNED